MAAETDIAYLAGLFDGEGTVSICEYKNKNAVGLRLRVSISNTHLPALVHIQELFGGRIDPADTRNSKPVFRLVFEGKSATFALEIMKPYLIIKKEVAEAGIQFQGTIGGHRPVPSDVLGQRAALRNRVHLLNRKAVG